MATGRLGIERIAMAVLAAVVTLDPIALLAVQTTSGIDDRRAENRIVVMVPASDAQVGVGARISQAAMLHVFRVEVLDAEGQVVSRNAAFQLTLYAGSADADLRALVTLDQGTREVSLPKPLGYRMERDDSIRIVATFTNAQDGHLRLTIEYDRVGHRASRLGVHALSQVRPTVRDSVATRGARRSWSWKAESGGRMLAVAGTALVGAVEMVLWDETAGVVVWRAPAGATTQTQRLGIAVQAGRIYTLTAIFNTGAASEVGGSIVALALPNGGGSR
jgi:hypothetical protein